MCARTHLLCLQEPHANPTCRNSRRAAHFLCVGTNQAQHQPQSHATSLKVLTALQHAHGDITNAPPWPCFLHSSCSKATQHPSHTHILKRMAMPPPTKQLALTLPASNHSLLMPRLAPDASNASRQMHQPSPVPIAPFEQAACIQTSKTSTSKGPQKPADGGTMRRSATRHTPKHTS